MISGGSFSGRFDLSIHDAATGRLRKSLSFPNLITNYGLIAYCSSNVFRSIRAAVGKGTKVPAPEDTLLDSFFIATTATGELRGNASTPSAPDWISSTTVTLRFTAGTFNGDTLSEIGIMRGDVAYNVSGELWCRALILDAMGNPSTITVKNNEYLDVKYTLFYHPDLTDTEFQFEMDGFTYNCVARAAKVNDGVFKNLGYGHALARGPLSILSVFSSQTLGEVTGEPAGSRINFNKNINNYNYSNERPYSYTSTYPLGLGEGNFSGGIGSMVLGTVELFAYGIMNKTQVSFDPKLPKDINTEMNFTLSKTISRWIPPATP